MNHGDQDLLGRRDLVTQSNVPDEIKDKLK